MRVKSKSRGRDVGRRKKNIEGTGVTLEQVKLGLFQDSGLGVGFTRIFGLMIVHSTKYSELSLTRECRLVCA